MEKLFSLNMNLYTPQRPIQKETSLESPIIICIEFEPHFPISKTKISVVFGKTQDIILELLLNSAEIYLVQVIQEQGELHE